MRCPECLSDHVEIREYDYGICRETGYHDAGERFRCTSCGVSGDAEDLVADVETPCKSGSFLALAGRG
jgi:hypothetical protein